MTMNLLTILHLTAIVIGLSDAQRGRTAGGGQDTGGGFGSTIPGQAGVDYPIYNSVPQTGFNCDGKAEGGYYADPGAECQAFHICTTDVTNSVFQYSFLCPNGTVFNQQYFICDWWFNVDCSRSESLYAINDEIAAQRDLYTNNDSG